MRKKWKSDSGKKTDEEAGGTTNEWLERQNKKEMDDNMLKKGV